MQASYLLFLSESKPHWDDCLNMFSTGKSKKIQVKLAKKIQQ